MPRGSWADQAQAPRGQIPPLVGSPAESKKEDVLARKFEEALKKAKEQPAERPVRDFDLQGSILHLELSWRDAPP